MRAAKWPKQLQKKQYLQSWGQVMEDNSEGCGGLVFLIILVVVYLLIKGGSGIGKYEGLTAEEWADDASYWETKYQEYKDCAEDSIPEVIYHCD